MKKDCLTAIVVTYNSEKYIENCLRTLLQSRPENYELRVIVIDNNSNDGTLNKATLVADKQKNIEIICNKKNLGFAKAVNVGLKKSKAQKYCLLLNPDTILKKDSIKKLLDCAKYCEASIVGGLTVGEKGIQTGSYFRFPNIWVGVFDFTNLRKLSKKDYWHNFFYYKDTAISKRVCNYVDVVTGGYMLIDQKVIDSVGLFDERFFMYLEDVDFCFRAKMAGFKIAVSNESKIYHYGGGSSPNKYRIRHTSWLWSRKYYYLKNFNIFINLLIQPIFLIDDLVIIMKNVLKL